VCVCVYIYIYIYIYVYIYICMYKHTHTHTHTHPHVNIQTYKHILFGHSRWAAPRPDQTWANDNRSNSTIRAKLVYQFSLNSALGYQIPMEPFDRCPLETLVKVPASFRSRNESERSYNHRPRFRKRLSACMFGAAMFRCIFMMICTTDVAQIWRIMNVFMHATSGA
jgi:hypothetical protein